ncbi:MAG: hypothetical protein ACI3W8_03995, partial [Oscillospiraceae bacterium]
ETFSLTVPPDSSFNISGFSRLVNPLFPSFSIFFFYLLRRPYPALPTRLLFPAVCGMSPPPAAYTLCRRGFSSS